MRLTPYKLMMLLRAGAVIAGLAAVAALSGPFKYSDLNLPFPDTVAHAMLFYGLTLVATGALPRSRAFDVALAFVGLGVASEFAQSMVGREMSLHDVFGDAAGVTAAYAPVAIARLRELARTHPHVSFAELRRMDRRSTRGERQPAAEPKTAA
jgi:VanZ family protein